MSWFTWRARSPIATRRSASRSRDGADAEPRRHRAEQAGEGADLVGPVGGEVLVEPVQVDRGGLLGQTGERPADAGGEPRRAGHGGEGGRDQDRHEPTVHAPAELRQRRPGLTDDQAGGDRLRGRKGQEGNRQIGGHGARRRRHARGARHQPDGEAGVARERSEEASLGRDPAHQGEAPARHGERIAPHQRQHRSLRRPRLGQGRPAARTGEEGAGARGEPDRTPGGSGPSSEFGRCCPAAAAPRGRTGGSRSGPSRAPRSGRRGRSPPRPGETDRRRRAGPRRRRAGPGSRCSRASDRPGCSAPRRPPGRDTRRSDAGPPRAGHRAPGRPAGSRPRARARGTAGSGTSSNLRGTNRAVVLDREGGNTPPDHRALPGLDQRHDGRFRLATGRARGRAPAPPWAGRPRRRGRPGSAGNRSHSVAHAER